MAYIDTYNSQINRAAFLNLTHFNIGILGIGGRNQKTLVKIDKIHKREKVGIARVQLV